MRLSRNPCAVLLFAPVLLFAQVQTAWVRNCVVPGNTSAWPAAIALDRSGAVYVAGWQGTIDYDVDYVTVKYSSEGAQQWVAQYNSSADSIDKPYAVAVDDSANVHVTGESWGAGTYYDYTTVRYDSAGVEQWVARYDDSLHDYDGACAVAVDPKGGILVAGTSTNFILVIKYRPNDSIQWIARYRGPADNYVEARAMAVDCAGNCFVTGVSQTGNPDHLDYATVKFDSTGALRWAARYDGPAHDRDMPNAIAFDSSGDVYVAGASIGIGTDFDYATVKYDSNGTEQWARRYNGPQNYYDGASAIRVDRAGNAFVTGASYATQQGAPDYATMKYSTSGVLQWIRTYDGPGQGSDAASALALDSADNVYVTGESYGGSGSGLDFATLKYDSAGNRLWLIRYNAPDNSTDQATAMATDGAGNVCVTGRTGNYPAERYTTIKYTQLAGMGQTMTRHGTDYGIDCVPEPFRDKVEIRLTPRASFARSTDLQIRDVAGRLVRTFRVPEASSPAPYTVVWAGTDNFGHAVPAGCYFLTLKSEVRTVQRRLLLTR